MNTQNNNNSDNPDNSEMVKTFYNIYVNCVKYKKEKRNSTKNINCDEFYSTLMYYTEKCIKNQKQNK